MKRATERDLLRQALRELPPRDARPGFTRGVLAELGRRRARRGRSPVLQWAVALLACAVLVGGLARLQQHRERERIRHRAEALRVEYEDILREVEQLRSVEWEAGGWEATPVLYLGSTEDLDVVMSLEPYLEARGGTAVPAARRSTGEPR